MTDNNTRSRGPAVLFVCTGNICRSPTAEAVLRHVAEDPDVALTNLVSASAGTQGYHVGEPADERAIATAAAHGIDMQHHRARQVTQSDFYQYDLIIALDRSHLQQLQRLAPSDASARLSLFMEFANTTATADNSEDVPDPYYGDLNGFEEMMTLIKEVWLA